MKPVSKPPGTKRLKLIFDEQLSSFAFKFNLRRHTVVLDGGHGVGLRAGRCRLTL
jgi:hypothetical protein